jgi:hypothetical protein
MSTEIHHHLGEPIVGEKSRGQRAAAGA